MLRIVTSAWYPVSTAWMGGKKMVVIYRVKGTISEIYRQITKAKFPLIGSLYIYPIGEENITVIVKVLHIKMYTGKSTDW